MGDEFGRGAEVVGMGWGGQSALTTQLRAFHLTLTLQAESSFVCSEAHEIFFFWGGSQLMKKNPKL